MGLFDKFNAMSSDDFVQIHYGLVAAKKMMTIGAQKTISKGITGSGDLANLCGHMAGVEAVLWLAIDKFDRFKSQITAEQAEALISVLENLRNEFSQTSQSFKAWQAGAMGEADELEKKLENIADHVPIPENVQKKDVPHLINQALELKNDIGSRHAKLESLLQDFAGSGVRKAKNSFDEIERRLFKVYNLVIDHAKKKELGQLYARINNVEFDGDDAMARKQDILNGIYARMEPPAPQGPVQ